MGSIQRKQCTEQRPSVISEMKSFSTWALFHCGPCKQCKREPVTLYSTQPLFIQARVTITDVQFQRKNASQCEQQHPQPLLLFIPGPAVITDATKGDSQREVWSFSPACECVCARLLLHLWGVHHICDRDQARTKWNKKASLSFELLHHHHPLCHFSSLSLTSLFLANLFPPSRNIIFLLVVFFPPGNYCCICSQSCCRSKTNTKTRRFH